MCPSSFRPHRLTASLLHRVFGPLFAFTVQPAPLAEPSIVSVRPCPFRALVLAASLLVATPFVARAQTPTSAPDPRDSIDVASLTFDGAHEVATSDLKTVLFTRTSSCRLILFAPICKLTPNLLFTDRRRTTRDALGEDITNLRVYYWRRGYREAQVDTVLAPAKRGMAVTFRIVEGGQLAFTSSDASEVDGFVMYRNGDHVGSKLPE